jgi:glycosyltransferase involved in cell wall biosynthesis
MNPSTPAQKRFKIAFDTRALEPGFKAHFGRGTGRYVQEILNELRMFPEELQIVPLEFSQSFFEKTILELAPIGKTTIQTQIFYPHKLKQLDAELIHFFAHTDAPSYCAKPYSVTVLDLIPLKFAALYQPQKISWRFRLARYLEQLSIKNAAGILAISECTKRDLIELLGINESKIYVTPLAVSERFSQNQEIVNRQELLRQLSIPLDRPKLLYVGGMDARKNIRFLMKVFKELHQQTALKPFLILAGPYQKDHDYLEIKPFINQHKTDMADLGFVDEQTLTALYQISDLFVFPSLYEGFGFPVLEALAAKLPVVAGDNSSIPEVVGADYPLCKDNNLESWVSGIVSILTSAEKRRLLIELGSKRPQVFSWAKTARVTLDAIKQISNEKNI